MSKAAAKFDDHLPCNSSPQDRHHFNRSDTEETKKKKVDEPAFSNQNQDDPG
jgi:hypothetical protein